MTDDGSKKPGSTNHINPPPRRRMPRADAAALSPDTPKLGPASGQRGGSVPPQPPVQAAASEDEPSRPYKVGYKKPPLEHRFKEKNKGGPGRTKDKKSQDTLAREQLLKRRTIRIGNRNRQVTTLELLNTLMVDGLLKEREHRHIVQVLGDARRLFPEQALTQTDNDRGSTAPPSGTDQVILDLYAEEIRAQFGGADEEESQQ